MQVVLAETTPSLLATPSPVQITFPTGVIPPDCSRKEVLKELSPRTEQVFYVPQAEKKAEPNWQQHDILGKLMPKWLRP